MLEVLQIGRMGRVAVLCGCIKVRRGNKLKVDVSKSFPGLLICCIYIRAVARLSEGGSNQRDYHVSKR